MFPIHDRHGRVIGFGGRVMKADQQPKYLNSPETVIFQKSRELYGLHQILNRKQTIDCIILVEGYMDVIALAQHGILNAVATLGTSTSTYHIQLLAKHTQQLIFCFDGDAAGRQAAWRALESSLPHLNAGLDAGFIFLPEEHDPDSLVRMEGAQGFQARLEQAIPLHRFFFDTLTKNLHLENPAGKTQLIQSVKPFLQKMPEGPYKLLMITELSRLTRLQQNNLEQLIADANPPQFKERNIIHRTPLRIAIALLLQNPEIYPCIIDCIEPHLLHAKEHQGLIRLLQLLANNPQANTAILLEAWRKDPHFDSMNQLAAWNHQVPEKERIQEFIDIVLFLQKQNHEQCIRHLIEKSRQQGLTESERITLQNLLKKRHIPDKIEK
jgi:DNA primase